MSSAEFIDLSYLIPDLMSHLVYLSSRSICKPGTPQRPLAASTLSAQDDATAEPGLGTLHVPINREERQLCPSLFLEHDPSRARHLPYDKEQCTRTQPAPSVTQSERYCRRLADSRSKRCPGQNGDILALKLIQEEVMFI